MLYAATWFTSGLAGSLSGLSLRESRCLGFGTHKPREAGPRQPQSSQRCRPKVSRYAARFEIAVPYFYSCFSVRLATKTTVRLTPPHARSETDTMSDLPGLSSNLSMATSSFLG